MLSYSRHFLFERGFLYLKMTDYLYFIVQVKVISYKNTWKML